MAYGYYMEISVNDAAVGANETNFPVALVLTSGNLATTANGGHVENTDANGGTSGSLTVPADFVVSPDMYGSSSHDFEILDYDATTGYIELWVEIDSLSSSTGATIYLVYGDSGVTTSQENVSGTWGNNFAGVWHMQQGGNGTAYDSVGTYDASDNASASGTTGQIGDGQEFDGSDDYYDPGGVSEIDPDVDFTVSLWVNFETLPTSDRSSCLHTGIDGDFGFNVGWRDGEGLGVRFYDFNAGSDLYKLGDSSYSTTGSYSHLATTWDQGGSSGVFYLDSVSKSDSINVGAYGGGGGRITKFGSDDGINYPLDGFLDEIQVHSVTRDSDWIATSFNNQDDPTPSSTFWSALGAEQAITTATINLTWQDNSEHEDGFSLERRQDGGAWGEIDTPAADDESYSDTGLARGHTYDYRIKAKSTALGDSEWSKEASETV